MCVNLSPLTIIKNGNEQGFLSLWNRAHKILSRYFTVVYKCSEVCWLQLDDFDLWFQALARQLAEVLIRGMCEKTYIPIDMSQSDSNKLSRPQPRKYTGEK